MPATDGKKRLTVRLKSTPQKQTPDNRQDVELLRQAVRAIQAGSSNSHKFSLEVLFSSVQGQVEARQGPALHALLDAEFSVWAAAEVAALATHLALDTTTFLQRVVALWEHYSHHLDLIRPVPPPTCFLSHRVPFLAAPSQGSGCSQPPTLNRLRSSTLLSHSAGRSSCTWTEHTWLADRAHSACFSWACSSYDATWKRCRM